jgi:hypothetical protein
MRDVPSKEARPGTRESLALPHPTSVSRILLNEEIKNAEDEDCCRHCHESRVTLEMSRS